MKTGLKPNKSLWGILVILVFGFISCNHQAGSNTQSGKAKSKIALPDTLTPITAKAVQESTENTVGTK